MRLHHLAILLALPALTAATLPRDEPERAADSADKVVCKRFIRTGSLIDGYRVCKTKAQWEHDRANIRVLSTIDGCRLRAEPDPLKMGGGCAM
ncbi:hypothetical protein [Sphingomonas sp.]|uniref:hypothetical protein n=1 Tax=Sphingomonas sp. TaxID=28214 RepID=UPI0025D9A446|nr:hypothetical protein [Sphingomonas sp.]